MKRLFAALLALLVLMIGLSKEVNATDAGSEERIDRLLTEFRRETKCTSVNVVTRDHGNIRIYGEEDGLWQIGSMTKAFTGLAIQKLIHEGKISGDDKVSEFLTGFEAFYAGERVEITIGQLMTQTSGYTNSESTYPSAEKGESLREWTKRISGRELQAAPGETYAYSNVNYNLLGAVIEVVSGELYQDYMEREILAPLGLFQTYAGEPDQDGAGSSKVVKGGRLLFRNAVSYELPVREGAIPAGYFYSSITDMGRWMEIWIGTADIPAEYQELIREIKAKLQNKGDYYAGWECFEDGVIGHSGGTPNYSSRIVFSEKEKVGACVLVNLNVAASTDSLCNGLYGLLGGGEAKGIAKDVWTVFDEMFTALCVLGMIELLVCIWSKKRGILLLLGSVSIVIMAVTAIILPVIFGAGLDAILFTWAPWSLAIFFGVMILDALVCLVKWRRLGKYEDHTKTGKGSAPHGDH
ncbi:MAG: beta-lactamase family protein [Lachnospiraceae bacterium]|nr:beta-lactamase family protein [Lachnospiraceae bacterium]